MESPFESRTLELESKFAAEPDWPDGLAVVAVGDLASRDWAGSIGHHAMLGYVLAADADEATLGPAIGRLSGLAGSVGGLASLDRIASVWRQSSAEDLESRMRVWRDSGVDFRLPVDDRPIEECLEEKHDLETQRTSPQERSRHIRLADGALDDLYFLTSMLLRHTEVSDPAFPGRLRTLWQAGLVNAVEHDQLMTAWRLFKPLEFAMVDLKMTDQTVPENPDKLAAIARRMGAGDANDLLREFQSARESVALLLHTMGGRRFAS